MTVVRNRAARWAIRWAPLAMLAAAAWVLWREFHTLTLAQILDEVAAWGPGRIAAAGLFTAISFSLLAVVEWLGLRWAGVKAPFRVSAAGAFCGNAFAHALGFALVTGSAIRVQLYAPFGASIGTVAQVTAFYGVTFGLGMAGLGGLFLAFEPEVSAAALHITPMVSRVAGALLLLGPVVYVVACARLRGELRIFDHPLSLPPARIAVAQVVLGLVDNGITTAVVWVLLPHALVSYPTFIGPYVLATLAGMISHVPGGAGVFEGVILTLLPDAPRPALAAAFLGYRLIYYAVPLTLASLLLLRAGLSRRASRIPPEG